MHFFVSGTDTDVGKTYVACLIIRALRKKGIDAVGMKPICCGDRGDAEALQEASGGGVPLNAVNPVWLRTPAAPYTAAIIEERQIDLELIREEFGKLKAAHQAVVVEGAGGWMVPIARDYFIRDLARELGLPVYVVAANRLGALNHSLLTVEAVQRSGLVCLGVIWNEVVPTSLPDPATATNRAVLEALIEARGGFAVEHGQGALRESDIADVLSAIGQR